MAERETLPGLSSACAACPAHHAANLRQLGIDMESWDFVVALAGNPNVGKSTVFNALTGLRQHTGNWPGKTVARAEGGFAYAEQRYKLVDLPGTYSLLATSTDEEIARDFILFGRPDVTVVVVDATRLERNLNLVLQVMQITDRVVVCLNLMDEAERHGIAVDERRLARDLGVPVIPTSARQRRGMAELLEAIRQVASGETVCRPIRVRGGTVALERAAAHVESLLLQTMPDLPNAHWVALRLLDADPGMAESLRTGTLASLAAADGSAASEGAEEILAATRELRWEVGPDFHQTLMESIYENAARIADRAVTRPGETPRFDLDRAIDRVVTSRVWGFPIMIGLFALVFWITIVGANVPSALLADLLLGKVYPLLHQASDAIGLPAALSGLLIDGMYVSTAWVVSVMLPPMAIFFPLFTLLEDFGYLPRVAFNLDGLFRRAGAHGKQSLSMMMGFGCNAAGVIATRVIDSPRERLIAILTNNFALCNGRWPTQILIASLFLGGLVSSAWAGLVSAAAVVGVAMLCVALSFLVSLGLSRTVLRGELSTFSLELPPYRPPNVLQTLYTSFIDRTLQVLWRAVAFAVPAGAVIWLISNIEVGGRSLADYMVRALDPLGILIGLNGVILVAYIVAIPANEIVIPTVLMLTVLVSGLAGFGEGSGVLFELEDAGQTMSLLQAGGWTLLTAVNLMLFSLIHNPCSTTIYTIYKETGSRKWTAVAALLPLAMGFAVTFVVAQIWRLVAGA